MGLIVIKISLQEKSYSGLKKRFPSMCETLEALRNPPLNLLGEERIIRKVNDSLFWSVIFHVSVFLIFLWCSQLIQLEIPEDTFKYYHTQQIMSRRKPNEANAIRETDILQVFNDHLQKLPQSKQVTSKSIIFYLPIV